MAVPIEQDIGHFSLAVRLSLAVLASLSLIDSAHRLRVTPRRGSEGREAVDPVRPFRRRDLVVSLRRCLSSGSSEVNPEHTPDISTTTLTPIVHRSRKTGHAPQECESGDHGGRGRQRWRRGFASNFG